MMCRVFPKDGGSITFRKRKPLEVRERIKIYQSAHSSSSLQLRWLPCSTVHSPDVLSCDTLLSQLWESFEL